MYDYVTDPKLSARWKRVFNTYDQFGIAGRKNLSGYKEYCKTLSFGQKMELGIVLLAVIFGPLWFVFKGMYRIAFVILFGIIVINVIIIGISSLLGVYIDGSVLGVGFGLAQGILANGIYYNYKARGYRGWNPFFTMSEEVHI